MNGLLLLIKVASFATSSVPKLDHTFVTASMESDPPVRMLTLKDAT